MPNGQSSPPPAACSRAPEVIFANWREMLNQRKLARDVRHSYAEGIQGYLDYCLGNGLSVGVESARGFVSDALRRGLTPVKGSYFYLWNHGRGVGRVGDWELVDGVLVALGAGAMG